MINAIELLKQDHRKVEKLFKEVEEATNFTVKTELFGQIAAELEAHITAEEVALYPKAERLEQTKGQALHSYKEHSDIRKCIEEVKKGNPSKEDWARKLQDLKETVEHHVSEEEGDFFPKIERYFTVYELEVVGREIENSKQQSKQKFAKAS